MSPNGGVTQSIATAEVKLSHVSKTARDAHIFSSLASGSLYSVGQLCDDGCKAYFNKTTCTITKKVKLVLSGTHTANSQLRIADDTKVPNALYYDASKVNNFHRPLIHRQQSTRHWRLHCPTRPTLCAQNHISPHASPFSMQLSSLQPYPPSEMPSMQDCYIPCQETSPFPKSEKIFASPK